MAKTKKTLFLLTVDFILLEIIFAMLMHNVSGMFSIFSYIYIISACIFCFLFKEKANDYIFTQLGLLGTLGADFFLVLLPEQERLPGMIFFSAVQIFYFFRLYTTDTNATRRKVHLILRIVLSVAIVALTYVVLGLYADPVAVVSMFYYTNLVLNVVFAFIDFKNTGVFAIGLLCFIISDTVIGFYNLDSYIGAQPMVREVVAHIKRSKIDLIYGFYLPSQALIAMSPAYKLFKKLDKEQMEKKCKA
ncbi:MAG: hypothetical protein IJW21_02925 [Clostridia bacterium]|nr:hypothetical protein [Clostridia bacterium]